MGLERIIAAIALASSISCAPVMKNTIIWIDVPTDVTGCEASYDKRQMQISCGAMVYDLFQKPVREERVYDIITGDSMTKRYYEAFIGSQRFVGVTEQPEGMLYPRRLRLEMPKAVMSLELDENGNIKMVNTEPRLSY